MSDVFPSSEEDPLPINVIAPLDSPKVASLREAAKMLSSARKPKQDEAAPVEAAPQPELSAEDNAAPPSEEPSGETEQPSPVEEPSVEPPRSWTSEDKQTFQSLPRVTQERLVELDRERELAVRKVQNETAEQRKTLDAQLKQAEQTRRQYEEALPVILGTLQSVQMGEFADIKGPADERRIASEDPVRYMQYLARQREVGMAQQEYAAAQQRQAQEQASQWQAYAQKEDALFIEKYPEFAGPKAKESSEAILDTMHAVGFSDDEIRQAYTQHQLARDHRMQEIFYKAAKYDKAQANLKAAPKKDVPPVPQRPGVARPVGMDQQQAIENLNTRLAKTGKIKDAADLLMAMRRARKA